MTDDEGMLIPQFPSTSHRLSLPRIRKRVWPIHDLVINEFLLWILPTHRRTLVLKFCAVITLDVYVAWKLFMIVAMPMDRYYHWSALFALACTLLFLLFWCYYYRRVLMEIVLRSNWWMDPGVTHHLRLPMHVPMRHYANEEQARRGACCIIPTKDSLGPNVWCLDSMPWKFSLQDTVPKGLAAVTGTDSVHWHDIEVPANWTMVKSVPDGPIYTNQKYPFPCQPPLVPQKNPTGIYRLDDFDVPHSWQSDALSCSFTIMLHGIESAAYVYCNGTLVGFTKDSRLPAEFDVTQQLRTHNNILHIVVVRWSDGSYVEDQDHWWMAGIHRSVELIRRPRGATLVDFQVQADASGRIAVQAWTQTSCTIVARLFEDEQLTADGDCWRKGPCIWETSDMTSATQGRNERFGAVLSGIVENPRLWNAEEPMLYTLTVTVLCHDGNVAQVESCRVGFRTVDIVNGILHVNSVPITVCGINRHEHDPDHGKVVSIEAMKKDICLMKQNNFNLVRTSHYPNHVAFYRLTDYFGLYVWDEANIETHGMKPMGRLAQDWGWEATFTERISRTIQRDRNHASIIFWSLGNEAGRGRNLCKARRLAKSLDLSRPIVYEGGGSLPDGTGWTELTDVICTMYPDVNRTKKLASRAKDDRPVILCEYSHAMGNSNGNLHLYWDAIWDKNLPKLQGGAIWDFVDQGLRLPDPMLRDRCYFGYGGDFGDVINDRQFCINGMWTPDRFPHPSVREIKFLQQPILIRPEHCEVDGTVLLDLSSENTISLVFSFENRYSFRKLSTLEWKWTITTNRSQDFTISKNFTVEDNTPTGIISVEIDDEVLSRMRSIAYVPLAKFWINFTGSIFDKCEWAPIGHRLVEIQYPMKIGPPRASVNHEVPASNECPKPAFETAGNAILVYFENSPGKRSLLASLNTSSGCLTSYSPMGRNLLKEEAVPSFCRAFTDNDRGGMELTLSMMFPEWCYHIYWLVRGTADFSYASYWKLKGLDPLFPPTIRCFSVRPIEGSSSDSISIEVLCNVTSAKTKSILFTLKLRYEFYGDGRIRILQKIKPCKSVKNVPSLPRVGMRFVLHEALYHIQYEGRGPDENYPDRKVGSHFGLFYSTPSDMAYLQYIVPSENGNRADCSFVAFREESGEGVCVMSTYDDNSICPFNCSVQLHSIQELHRATHTSELEARVNGNHPIHVNVDGALMGVGGDNSWFPVVYPEFLVSASKEYSFDTWLLPLEEGEVAIDVLAKNVSRGQSGGRPI